MSKFTEGWRRSAEFQWVYALDNDRRSVAIVTLLQGSGLWHPAFSPCWEPLHGYASVQDAKAYCEVTIKLCSS